LRFSIYMEIFKKSAVSLGKILFLTALAYLSLWILFAQNQIQLAIGFFIIVFITIPTIFIFFFKNNFLAKYPKMAILWKIYRVFYIIFIILVAIGLALGQYKAFKDGETQKTIDFINSKKITLDDVMGKNLPPKPDQTLNDSTIAGIDANNNYIRDDVELAIFEKYPNSAKIRAAELQYAQALQLELTQVYNSQIYIRVLQKEDLAYFCLGNTIEAKTIKEVSDLLDLKDEEINDFVLNTDLRLNKQSNNFEKYMRGYASPKEKECDIEI